MAEPKSQTIAPVRARPFLKWAGGKSQLLAEILPLIPQPTEKYYEPFLGGGAVFFRVAPARAQLSDINPDLINTYLAVRDNVEGVIAELKKHRYEKTYFYEIRDADRLASFAEWTQVERAARIIFLNKTCFNGLYRVNSRGHFNVPFGRYANPTIIDEDNLRASSSALRGAALSCQSFLAIEEAVTSRDFVYFDPPYAPLNKTSSFTSYSRDGFSEDMQVALSELCLRLTKKGVPLLLSNSDAPIIRDLYNRPEFQIRNVLASRALNSKAESRGRILELLVSNF